MFSVAVRRWFERVSVTNEEILQQSVVTAFIFCTYQDTLEVLC